MLSASEAWTVEFWRCHLQTHSIVVRTHLNHRTVQSHLFFRAKLANAQDVVTLMDRAWKARPTLPAKPVICFLAARVQVNLDETSCARFIFLLCNRSLLSRPSCILSDCAECAHETSSNSFVQAEKRPFMTN